MLTVAEHSRLPLDLHLESTHVRAGPGAVRIFSVVNDGGGLVYDKSTNTNKVLNMDLSSDN